MDRCNCNLRPDESGVQDEKKSTAETVPRKKAREMSSQTYGHPVCLNPIIQGGVSICQETNAFYIGYRLGYTE